jgi:hypothetical protein
MLLINFISRFSQIVFNLVSPLGLGHLLPELPDNFLLKLSDLQQFSALTIS